MGWQVMSGLDWNALEITAEHIGVEDPDLWIVGLVTIRDWFEDKRRADIARQRRATG